ncbi:MAG: selenocysteine-specific translation elongation factor [Chloroflexi bacterium]|nr:selenocysteine-specific translation elongation factor [Chloroflexota bacterium]
MYVLGTAGHVDHGKSALIRALTGTDPDRLREEKERGMTIDLGFAWMTLPGGREVSIVDVPGHERFISNMLAGVGGIDVALLVIAADEGVMPQTREHLAILDLIGVSSGIVVITKKDLVDKEWLELVFADAANVIKGTTLSRAPIVAVSAVTGEGLAELTQTIEKVLDTTPPKKDLGRPRLPVDRIFTIAGFGTVVTGTLIDGRFSLGQEVEIVPSGQRARIRGLQSHKKKVETAHPGNRVAINLTGVSTEQIERGQVVTTPGWLRPTSAMDARMRLLASVKSPLPHNAEIEFYSGSAEAPGVIRLLEKNDLPPGESTWVQIVTRKPVPVVKGDPFVVRSPNDTLGGGAIVQTHASRHRRFYEPTLRKLAALEKGSAEEIFLTVLRAGEPADLESLTPRTNLNAGEVEAVVQKLISEKQIFQLAGKGGRAVLISAGGYGQKKDQAIEAARNYHQQFPLRHGIPKEELRSRLKTAPQPFLGLLNLLIQDSVLVEEGAAVRLPSFQPALTREQEQSVEKFLQTLVENPYSPPSENLPGEEVLGYLQEQGKVVRVSADVVFSKAAFDEMVKRTIEEIRTRGKITLAEVRDVFQTSRKYAMALLEYLDEKKITRRVGDERFLK